ncbi:hypothetical protein [Kitasatospora sp. NPDC001527]|uniref:glycine-rich domain-containing protein n=1 Tax=Kitasatospora sp. NPDC001527 TaxID=3154519 RepID=UPI00331EAF12
MSDGPGVGSPARRGTASRPARVAAAAALCFGALASPLTGAAPAQAVTTTKTYATPGQYTFTVPEGVTTVTITLVGAGNGGGGGGPRDGAGGRGGTVPLGVPGAGGEPGGNGCVTITY